MGAGVANVACCSGPEELKFRLWTILLNLDMRSSNSAQHARLSTPLCVTVCFRGGGRGGIKFWTRTFFSSQDIYVKEII